MKKYKVIASGYLQGLGVVTEGATVELDAETGNLFKKHGFLADEVEKTAPVVSKALVKTEALKPDEKENN